jgi:SufS family cysteine desulfurase
MTTTTNNGVPPALAPAPPNPQDFDSDLSAWIEKEISSEFRREYELPSSQAVSIPPVHPLSQPPPFATPSGAHTPDSEETHPFGEPRCAGTLPGKTAAASPSRQENAGPALDYYFLRASSQRSAGFDVASARRDFPALHQYVNGHPLIWFDNAATTHKPQAVIDATSQFYARDNSNIHRAAHALAARSTELFEAAREKVRKFLGAASAKEIVFVRGTTEGINLVAQSYGRKNIGAGDEIILTELEHHANIVPWQLLAEQTGAVLRVVPINDRGELILEEYVKLFGAHTKFVALTHVSNALGTINPVEEIIALAHARGVPVLVDGAQSTPHLPINVTALDADFFLFSGHKIFGPTGIGVLYGKAALLESMPPWQGGGHMIKDVRFEKTTYQHAPEKFEAGTPDIAGVVGLGAAIDYLSRIGLPAIAAYEHSLLDYATEALVTISGLRLIGTAANKASVLSFVIPGVPNESIARHLDKQGIAVRAGHHCAQPAQRHFGLESTVRPSLAFYNTHDDVDALVRALRSLGKNAAI